jgi:hypothetical protein
MPKHSAEHKVGEGGYHRRPWCVDMLKGGLPSRCLWECSSAHTDELPRTSALDPKQGFCAYEKTCALKALSALVHSTGYEGAMKKVQ